MKMWPGGMASLFCTARLVAAPVLDTAVEDAALLSRTLPIARPEDLRDSVKWKGFVAAQEAAAGGDWNKTRQLVFALRELVPDNLMLLEQKARLHQWAGEWAEAETAWYEFIARQPHRLDVMPELALALLRQDRGAEAERVAGVVLARAPGHLDARWVRVLAGLRANRRVPETWSVPEMAHLCLRLADEPRRWVAWLGEGAYRDVTAFVWSGGQWDTGAFLPAAIGDLGAASRKMAPALVDAEQAMALGQWPRALASLEVAETAGASGPVLAAYRAYAQGHAGQAGPALRSLGGILRQHPDHPLVLSLRGHLLLALQRFPEARADFDRLPAQDPEALFGRMLGLLGEGESQGAWTLYVDLATRFRPALLRLLRQHEPLLEPLRARPDFLHPLRPTPPTP